ncbi:hypothetical protein BO85DRAFT_81595 [Aspergillus piperis CBS 112811]|uniref:Uncharacterized protein n=1 Tax=Aspergillus piperis CBS 112811 TaxID=1448313 RepID=A0A8G1VM00_9EURO|nr:hypothetical protein BO85DRAFT_81595 [Aspergillus piperis CBS 112811]RAH55223.1 hypothetical protein BO85DRAFT_81595 [Aspergillus piperis CBS 112811]
MSGAAVGHVVWLISPDTGVDGEAKLIELTLEAVEWYPRGIGDFRLLDKHVSVSGYGCGLFRGIVAAIIIENYAAAALPEDLASGFV